MKNQKQTENNKIVVVYPTRDKIHNIFDIAMGENHNGLKYLNERLGKNAKNGSKDFKFFKCFTDLNSCQCIFHIQHFEAF